MERAGRRVRYLNIGDPVQFGFATRRTWSRPSPGPCATGTTTTPRRLALSKRAKPWPPILPRAACPCRRSRPHHLRHFRGLELALTAIVDEGESVLVPSPTYPLYTAVLAKIGAHAGLLPHRSEPWVAAGSR